MVPRPTIGFNALPSVTLTFHGFSPHRRRRALRNAPKRARAKLFIRDHHPASGLAPVAAVARKGYGERLCFVLLFLCTPERCAVYRALTANHHRPLLVIPRSALTISHSSFRIRRPPPPREENLPNEPNLPAPPPRKRDSVTTMGAGLRVTATHHSSDSGRPTGSAGPNSSATLGSWSEKRALTAPWLES